MAELNFEIASLGEIATAYFSEGCVLLRKFVTPEALMRLIAFVDKLYEEIGEDHVSPSHLQARGHPSFHEYIFNDKHDALLRRVFGESPYGVSEDTATRRVAAAVDGGGGHWQAPLGPHLDSLVHPLPFTVNFWLPFRDCGTDAPSLAVVRAPFDDILKYSGYGSVSADDAGPNFAEHPGWNFQRFYKKMFSVTNKDPQAIEEFQRVFADRIWTPTYSFGDAMMLSNWTLHLTHALPTMTERRGNIELRFISERTVEELTEMHRDT